MTRQRVAEATAALNAAHVAYLAIGRLAILAHGGGGATYSCEFALDSRTANIHAARDALTALGFEPAGDVSAPSVANATNPPQLTFRRKTADLDVSGVSRGWPDIELHAVPSSRFMEMLSTALATRVVPSVSLPVTGMAALLKRLRRSHLPRDMADLEDLETIGPYSAQVGALNRTGRMPEDEEGRREWWRRVRAAMPVTDGRIEMPALDPWEASTFEGARYEAIRAAAAMTFAERLDWMTEVQRMAESACAQRAAESAAAEQAAAQPDEEPPRKRAGCVGGRVAGSASRAALACYVSASAPTRR